MLGPWTTRLSKCGQKMPPVLKEGPKRKRSEHLILDESMLNTSLNCRKNKLPCTSTFRRERSHSSFIFYFYSTLSSLLFIVSLLVFLLKIFITFFYSFTYIYLTLNFSSLCCQVSSCLTFLLPIHYPLFFFPFLYLYTMFHLSMILSII